MPNFKLSTKVIIVVAFICFVLFLVFVSLLGVNNNAQSDVKRFLQQISSRDYAGVLEFYSEKAKAEQTSFQEAMKFHFALELALLEHFDLMDTHRYSIKIRRDNMWLPVLTTNELGISVKLAPQRDTNPILEYLSSPGPNTLIDFITMTRENGKWKISSINIKGSKLEDIFNDILPRVATGKYVNVTPEKITLRPVFLKVKELDPLERKILARDLQTALEIIDKDGGSRDKKSKLPF